MKILAIGSHFDDVELGCGGSLLKLKSQGHKLFIFTASLSGYADPQGRIIRDDEIAGEEGRKAANYLGATLLTGEFPTFELEFAEPLNCAIMKTLHQVQPDIVFTHWSGDIHHDHRAVALSSLHCCRHVPGVLTYCSNWYDSESLFAPRFFIDISETFAEKLTLIALYQSEHTRTHSIWDDYVKSRSRLMGLKAGVEFAEGFEVVKWRM